MPKIIEAIKDGHIKLQISINEEKDLAALDLLDHVIAGFPEHQTMENVLILLDNTRWWAITLGSAHNFAEFMEQEKDNGEIR